MGLREAAGLEGAEPQVVHGSPLARVVVQLRGQRFLHAVLHQQLDHYAPRHLEVGASLRRVDRRAQPRTKLLDFVVVVVIIVVVIIINIIIIIVIVIVISSIIIIVIVIIMII